MTGIGPAEDGEVRAIAVRYLGEEAGGQFTSLNGHEGAIHGSGVASNGVLHDRLIDLLRT
mgnify:CR=1 FL=1